MTPEAVMTIGQRALEITMLLSMPLLLAALVIGLLVGVFQAATQINEMTLSFIPKLVGMAGTLVVAGPWMLKTIVGDTRELFESIPGLIGGHAQHHHRSAGALARPVHLAVHPHRRLLHGCAGLRRAVRAAAREVVPRGCDDA